MISAYIALGSNLGDPLAQIEQALHALSQLPQSRLVAASRCYRSTPWASMAQPDYINAVAQIETELTPLALLDALQAIEAAQGRERLIRWGARTLDLDLLLYGTQIIRSERLTVPHYAMHERPFVLYPLADIAPNLQLPDGTALSELLQRVPFAGLEALEAPPFAPYFRN